MTLQDTSAIVPAWRVVHSDILNRDIQVRRVTVGDVSLPTAEMWIRLVRDGDGTPLLHPSVSPASVDPTLVEEVCRLAMAVPTGAVA